MFVKRQWSIPSNPCNKSGTYLSISPKMARNCQIFYFPNYVSTFLDFFYPPTLCLPFFWPSPLLMVSKKKITLGSPNQLEVHKWPLSNNIIILVPKDSLIIFCISFNASFTRFFYFFQYENKQWQSQRSIQIHTLSRVHQARSPSLISRGQNKRDGSGNRNWTLWPPGQSKSMTINKK